MSRTRGIRSNDAIALSPLVQHMDDGEIVPPVRHDAPLPAIANAPHAFVCDHSTWQRDMEGVEALRLLDMMVGPLSIELTPEDFRTLNPNLKRHFRARRE